MYLILSIIQRCSYSFGLCGCVAVLSNSGHPALKVTLLLTLIRLPTSHLLRGEYKSSQNYPSKPNPLRPQRPRLRLMLLELYAVPLRPPLIILKTILLSAAFVKSTKSTWRIELVRPIGTY